MKTLVKRETEKVEIGRVKWEEKYRKSEFGIEIVVEGVVAIVHMVVVVARGNGG